MNNQKFAEQKARRDLEKGGLNSDTILQYIVLRKELDVEDVALVPPSSVPGKELLYAAFCNYVEELSRNADSKAATVISARNALDKAQIRVQVGVLSQVIVDTFSRANKVHDNEFYFQVVSDIVSRRLGYPGIGSDKTFGVSIENLTPHLPSEMSAPITRAGNQP